MDSHLGIWTNDLPGYITKLNQNGRYGQMINMSWKGNKMYSDSTFYSVMFEACPGYFVELITSSSSGINKSVFILVDEPRLDFTRWQEPDTTMDSVVKVSRATTKIDEMVDFYTNIIGGTLIQKDTYDGTKWAIVKLDHATAHLHFVDRPASKDASFTVKDLESYMNQVHDKYVKSTNCGFDQYADHHWAYDYTGPGTTLESVTKKLEAGGYKYRQFLIASSHYQVYAFDPSGWTFQLDLGAGGFAPKVSATYSAACKSDDGCYGQGLCDDTEEGHFYYATKTWENFLQ